MLSSFAGCGEKKQGTDSKPDTSKPVAQPTTYINPLTGYMHLNEKEKPVSEQTSHAVTIIGWDDNYSVDNNNSNNNCR